MFLQTEVHKAGGCFIKNSLISFKIREFLAVKLYLHLQFELWEDYTKLLRIGLICKTMYLETTYNNC